MINMTCPHCKQLLKIPETYQGERGICNHCRKTIHVCADPPHVVIPPEPKATPIKCIVCDEGILVKKEVYRMSIPVVIIGYLLLIPSMFCTCFFILGVGVSNLMAAFSDPDLFLITLFTGGFTVLFIVIPIIVGSLLGWLLIMKKKILQCTCCEAIIPAS